MEIKPKKCNEQKRCAILTQNFKIELTIPARYVFYQ